MNDGMCELGAGGVSSQVSGPDFAGFDDVVNGLSDDVSIAMQLHVAQHVGTGEQHRGRVGGVLTNGT